jgi:predicted DsbA family dithiol-disulfide isomerase
VPTFILNRKLGVSGAHPPEALAQAIQEALK